MADPNHENLVGWRKWAIEQAVASGVKGCDTPFAAKEILQFVLGTPSVPPPPADGNAG